jgi:DNA-binding transcriptional MerR regulator
MALTVTTRVLSERSGLPVRQVQTLSDAGVLKPDSGTETPGRGGSRQYSMLELDLAILLGSILHKGISAIEAAVLSEALRPTIQAPTTYGFKTLEQAGQMRRLAKAQQVQKSDPKDLQRQAQQIIQDLKHVVPDTPFDATSVQYIEGWMMIEMAKQGKADAVLLLTRDEVNNWKVRFWVNGLVESRAEKGGEPSADARAATQAIPPHYPDLVVGDLTVEIKHSNAWPDATAGYFITLRSLFASGR